MKRTQILETWKASGGLWDGDLEPRAVPAGQGPAVGEHGTASVFILCKRVLVVSCRVWILLYKSYKYSLFRSLVHLAPRASSVAGAAHGRVAPGTQGQSVEPGSQQVHLGSVVQQEGRLLEPPPRDHHELEGVVLAQDLLVAQDVQLVEGGEVQLLGDELLQV